METYYYELHVFYDYQNGFSIYIKFRAKRSFTTSEVINYALRHEFIDNIEAKHVDYVNEITKAHYASNKSK